MDMKLFALLVGYINKVAKGGGGGAVQSVNGKTGEVELNASDVGAVSSVNNKTGEVNLTATDVGAATTARGLPTGGSLKEVLYKKSSSNYDAGWRAIFETIWENPSPDNTFAAQTINNVNFGDHTWFLAEFRVVNTIPGTKVTAVLYANSAYTLTDNTPYNNKLRQFVRDITLGTDSITFGNASSTTEGGTTTAANNLLIPERIVGIF